MPFNIGPIEVVLFAAYFLLPSAIGFWIWQAKRQQKRWVGAVVGFALGWLSIIGWITLLLIAALWKPVPEVDDNRQLLAPQG